jgi:outer membrane protein
MILTIIFWSNKPKTAFVDLGKVYSEFTLKKELEIKLKQVQTLRQNELDSMKLELTVLAKNLQSPGAKNASDLQTQFTTQRNAYALKSQSYSDENDRVSQSYDDQIWKQLNEYIKNYGKEKKYNYIFGAEGSGSIMYADASDDITTEVTTYVNEQYKGSPAK